VARFGGSRFHEVENHFHYQFNCNSLCSIFHGPKSHYLVIFDLRIGSYCRSYTYKVTVGSL
jgi:hypothetical protein